MSSIAAPSPMAIVIRSLCLDMATNWLSPRRNRAGKTCCGMAKPDRRLHKAINRVLTCRENAQMVTQSKNLITGKMVANGQWLDVVNPANEGASGQVTDRTAGELKTAGTAGTAASNTNA